MNILYLALVSYGHRCLFANAFGVQQTIYHATQTTRRFINLDRPSRRSQQSAPGTRTQLFASEVATQSSKDKYDDLIQWLLTSNEKSYIASNVEIRPSTRGGLATGGYGMFASEDLTEGELLLRIPRNCCVTLDDALNDDDILRWAAYYAADQECVDYYIAHKNAEMVTLSASYGGA